jgi:hypothetical protein
MLHYEGYMAALDTTARREGHKAMEGSISAAARVRRQLRAGRPRKTHRLDLNSFEVMGRLVSEADRANSLMGEAGLDPADLRLGLIVRTTTDLQCKWLPASEEAGIFFAAISAMAGAEFLGILWKQADRETHVNGLPLVNYWVTPFVAGPEAERLIEAIRSAAAVGIVRLQAN